MTPLLSWTLLTVSLWTADSGHILLQKPVTVLYPKISSQAVIECDCVNISCKSVLWFRSTRSVGNLQFLGTCNNANRFTHGAGVAKERFQFDKRGTSSFVLRIANVMEEDGGIYSCVLKDMGPTHVWNPGSVLRPGVTPPTSPPPTKPKPPVKSVCRCPKKSPAKDGCDPPVLWPLVGLTAGLALALICTLYYFSRLPKKCRHHFVKVRQKP